MSNRSDREFLVDMLEACDRITEFTMVRVLRK